MEIGPSIEETKKENPRKLLKSYSRISVVDGAVNFSRKLYSFLKEKDIKVFKIHFYKEVYACSIVKAMRYTYIKKTKKSSE